MPDIRIMGRYGWFTYRGATIFHGRNGCSVLFSNRFAPDVILEADNRGILVEFLMGLIGKLQGVSRETSEDT